MRAGGRILGVMRCVTAGNKVSGVGRAGIGGVTCVGAIKVD